MKPVKPRLFLDRFLKYVTFDTQSSENSETFPSTEKQLELSRYLFSELQNMGLHDVELTEHGYVYATLLSNVRVHVPTIGFIAHVDTSPDVSGANVRPVINKKYKGGDIVLKRDKNQVIEEYLNPALRRCIGHDIITSDGTTLLGADNKAGIAEIMGALQYLIENPDVKHGTVRIAFTVDEEIAKGTKYFDVAKFGAEYAYTVDGETAGEIEDETFCADTAIITIRGVNVHPGYAKGKMVNSIKIAAELLTKLPREGMAPETTEKREGFIHPNTMTGTVEETKIVFLIRDFAEEDLHEKHSFLQLLCDKLSKKYPQADIQLDIQKSYRNMKMILAKHPIVMDNALEAIRRTGLKPRKNLVRGGTDGARLSFMGLPTPNIFTGGHNFHSKKEWVSVQDMEKAVETIVHLCEIWAERAL